jgi:penicillin-binding protein 2
MLRRLTQIFNRVSKTNQDDSGFIFLGKDFQGANFKLKEGDRGRWVESLLIDCPANELARPDKNYLGTSLNPADLQKFLLIIFLGLLLLFGRGFFLQVVRGGYYLNLAEKNRIRIFNIPSPRGIIYDANGAPLVKNVPNFTVYLTPADLFAGAEQANKTVVWLRQSLGAENVEERLKKIMTLKPQEKEYFEQIELVDKIEYQKALALKIASRDYPGVTIEVAAERQYLDEINGQKTMSLSHLIGYEAKISADEYEKLREQGYLYNDFIGKTGIEGSNEKLLRGKYGKEQIEVDAQGRAKKIIAKEEMEKGANLYLTIDARVQQKLEEILRKNLKGLKRAAAIALEPSSGKIKALVSLPAYDNNLFAAGITSEEFSSLTDDGDQPMFNRAISGEYPSGSTIKPVIAAAALEEKIIKEFTSFLSVGGIKIGDWFFPDWKPGGHGATDVRKALAESVNTFFYILGAGYGDFQGLGVYKIKEYAEKFGLNAKTGVALNNEQSGFLPTPEWKFNTKKEKWYISDTYNLAIGQGDLLATPLQIANMFAVFANGGELLKPQIVDRVYDQKSGKTISVEKEIIRAGFLSEETINIVRQGLRQAVTAGSAKKLKYLPVAAAAKTGTAEWSDGKPAHAWFATFAPYAKPELVLTVLVESGGEGSDLPADVAFEFLSWYFRK